MRLTKKVAVWSFCGQPCKMKGDDKGITFIIFFFLYARYEYFLALAVTKNPYIRLLNNYDRTRI